MLITLEARKITGATIRVRCVDKLDIKFVNTTALPAQYCIPFKRQNTMTLILYVVYRHAHSCIVKYFIFHFTVKIFKTVILIKVQELFETFPCGDIILSKIGQTAVQNLKVSPTAVKNLKKHQVPGGGVVTSGVQSLH